MGAWRAKATAEGYYRTENRGRRKQSEVENPSTTKIDTDVPENSKEEQITTGLKTTGQAVGIVLSCEEECEKPPAAVKVERFEDDHRPSDDVETHQKQSKSQLDALAEVGTTQDVQHERDATNTRVDGKVGSGSDPEALEDAAAVKEAQLKLKLAQINIMIRQAELEKKKTKLELSALRLEQREKHKTVDS